MSFWTIPNPILTLNNVTRITDNPNKNLRIFEGFQVDSNGGSTRSIGVFIPYLWSLQSNNEYAAMKWDNSQNGWYNQNFDGIGRLLVTIPNFPLRVEVGKIADQSGNQPFPLTTDCLSYPNLSCYNPPVNPTVPPSNAPDETLKPSDEVPFLDLGIFSPNEKKSFGITFQYNFLDDPNRAETRRTAIVFNTVTPIPEPSPVLGLGIMAIGGLAVRRKRQLQKSSPKPEKSLDPKS